MAARTGLAVGLLLVVGCAPMDRALERVRPAPVPTSPADAPPGDRGDERTWQAAVESPEVRIVVSRDARRLWLMDGERAVFAAPVAVGKDVIFRYGDQEWDFNTPTGRLRVMGKEKAPEWVPPDWHYYEKAVERELEPVHLRNDSRVRLSDGTVIEVRNGAVGRRNQYDHWRAFTPGGEIIFDGKIFIPPIGSPQRRIPEVLGTHRLILGDGYLIHGTPEEDSIGQWASHGCVRMLNRDVESLYGLVKEGTPVYVY